MILRKQFTITISKWIDDAWYINHTLPDTTWYQSYIQMRDTKENMIQKLLRRP